MIEKLFNSGSIDRRWVSRDLLDIFKAYYIDTFENDMSDGYGAVN